MLRLCRPFGAVRLLAAEKPGLCSPAEDVPPLSGLGEDLDCSWLILIGFYSS